MRDLYIEAQVYGSDASQNSDLSPMYWIARHAARQTAIAMLDEAIRLKLSAEQYEALRIVDADVAYD